MNLGDDLTKAREFVNAAETRLDQLLQQTRGDSDVVTGLLIFLRDGALAINARGISRSARGVMDALKSGAPDVQIDGRLLGLKNLLNQYKVGLDEITPMATDDASVTVKTVKVEPDWKQRSHEARSILKPLIKFANEPSHKTALESLAAFTPIKAESSSVHLESLMPTVTDHILAQARQVQKSVSVSYAADDIDLPKSLAPRVQDYLETLGGYLIEACLEDPKTRTEAGLAACGLISITAMKKTGQLTLQTDCAGIQQTQLPVSLGQALQSFGATIDVMAIAGGTRVSAININLSDNLVPLPVKAPLVVEAQL